MGVMGLFLLGKKKKKRVGSSNGEFSIKLSKQCDMVPTKLSAAFHYSLSKAQLRVFVAISYILTTRSGPS